jgi:hypothetical protein
MKDSQAINCLDFGELSRVATFILSLRDKGSIRLEGDDVKVIDMGAFAGNPGTELRAQQPLGPALAGASPDQYSGGISR